MKVSDLVTTSGQRLEAMQSRLQTEETDAVNTGVVHSASRDTVPLGGRAARGGAGGAALAAVSSRRGAARSAQEGSSVPVTGVDGGLSDIEPSDDIASSSRYRQKGRWYQRTGESAKAQGANDGHRGPSAGNPAVSAATTRRSLRSTLKVRARDAAVSAVSRKALEDTELEGVDDLYYKGAVAGKLLGKGGNAVRRGGRSVVRSASAVQERLFKRGGTGKDAAAAVESQRRAQAASYAKQTIYTTAAEARQAAATAKAATTLSGTVAEGGFAKALAATSSPLLVVILLVVCLIVCIVGGAAEQEGRDASMDGMPSWVTYELVVACLEARDEYGYPASALLGQMMIENGTSDEGSTLGRDYHNYGGVKYSGNDYGGLITGSVRLLTTEYTSTGTAYQTYADFAVFASDEAYMTYRCEYLYQQSNYTSVPEFQEAIDNNDSELFLTALGLGGYYTAPVSEYLAHYRSICKAYPLVPLLDGMSLEDFENTYGSLAGGGEEYDAAEDWQKRIADACRTTPSPGAGLCAAWVSNVYERAGFARPYGNGNTILANSTTTSTDWANIEVGQILSAQAAPTPDAAIYGHTAIYVGDGMVMENRSGSILTTPLAEWVSYYRAYGWVIYGWPW